MSPFYNKLSNCVCVCHVEVTINRFFYLTFDNLNGMQFQWAHSHSLRVLSCVTQIFPICQDLHNDLFNSCYHHHFSSCKTSKTTPLPLSQFYFVFILLKMLLMLSVFDCFSKQWICFTPSAYATHTHTHTHQMKKQ